jgi:hypothetical protein
MFAYHVLHKVIMMEQLQSNYMVTTCITNKLEELGRLGDCSPRLNLHVWTLGIHWLGVLSTFGTTVFGINSSRTFTTTKSRGISLPPTLLPWSPQIIVVATFRIDQLGLLKGLLCRCKYIITKFITHQIVAQISFQNYTC